jgi:formylglycine-generating enzyme required for sulfatase activity
MYDRRLGNTRVALLFISHSGANNAAAIALRDWLSEQGFDDVFLDVDPEQGLVVGQRWQDALKAAADRCEAVLFLISPAWLDSKWCLAEFLLAKTLHKRIFGLIVEPVPLERVPAEMTAEWQMCQLVGEDPLRTFDVPIGAKHETIAFRVAGLDLLRRGLERAGLDAKSFPWPPPGDLTRAPYRGLRALEPQDAAIFFGRDAAIVRGLDRIRGLVEGGVDKLFVVLGASGSGKSSFMRAGLWPRLARDDLTFLPLPVIRPLTAVISGSSGLASALTTAFERLGVARPPGRIKEALTADADGFGHLLDELSSLAKGRLVGIEGEHPQPTIVSAIDQAEELFNAEGTSEAASFLQLLAGVLAPAADGSPSRRLLALVTIRSDRYELLQAEPHLLAVKQDLFNLPPISPAEFKTVIEGPALRVVEAGGSLAIDPALTERLIADAQGADALPLLAFTLERLYADYGSEGKLTLAEYEKLGGVQGSIEEALARSLSEPSRTPQIPAGEEEQLASLRAAFIPWLARIDPENGEPMRRVARLDEIPETSRAIVQRLVEARLLLADRRAGADVVEVAHESLLRQWPVLAAWLQADSDDLKLVEGVERAAGEWARSGRQDLWLDHRSERLAAAIRVARREDFRRRLGEQGTAYLDACRKKDAAARRGTQFVQALIFASLVAVIIGLVGWIKQNYIADEWRWWTVTWPYARALVRSHVLTAAEEKALRPGDPFQECAQDCPKMIVVPAGSFMMGAPATEAQVQEYGSQIPRHLVTIAKRFAVSKYELTFADWDACVTGGGCNAYEPNDEDWRRGQQPVINVNWEDAQRYVAWLSAVTGKTYRLLSESEYEYTMRAGTTTAYPWGDDLGKNNANCDGCGSKWDNQQTAPVGSFAPNKFGLYDMVGNVWEWTEDCVHSNYNRAPTEGSAWMEANGGDCSNHVVRGGSWYFTPVYSRCAYRYWLSTAVRYVDLGFRVGRTLIVP